jgi:2,4-dienoyl-CoA reductase-like NADH-dependent reductase (Old Yellow Enzyme family)
MVSGYHLALMLFDPVHIPGLRLRNRLVLAPMTTYSSGEDGAISDAELAYLERRARGGFGMVITAACYVHKSGHAFPGQWGCSRDEGLPSLRSAAAAIKAGGAAAALQLHHGGRQAPSRLCGRPLSASAIPAERPGAETPAAMTEAEILETVEAFADATRRAVEAGFDAVEIHGANTYLLQQFVSPHSNRREDAWGRDRLKFPLAVVDACLSAAPQGFPVGYRFSPEELETPGIRVADTLRLMDALTTRPLAWLHASLRDFRAPSLHGACDEPVLTRLARRLGGSGVPPDSAHSGAHSAGDLDPAQMDAGCASGGLDAPRSTGDSEAAFDRPVRERTVLTAPRLRGRCPLIGVGSVWTRAEAEEAMALGAGLVAVGRAALVDPEWPASILRDGQPARRLLPAADAEALLTLPPGLVERLRRAPGWV